MFILVVGLAITLCSDTHLERRMIRRMFIVIAMLFTYSISCYAEAYLGNQVEYTIVRAILTALNYSLITFLLLNVIMIVYPEQRYVLMIPAIINAIICFASIPTKIVFHFSSDNCFHRGPLGYLTYVIDGLYLAYFIFILFWRSRVQKEDYSVLFFLAVSSVVCLVMPLFMYISAEHWTNVTIAIDVTIYYVYLLQQFTKRDPLTNLLNRQSYYADAQKYAGEITAFVAIDMDGLKEINDTYGHVAGDAALKALADCFWNAANRHQRVYRIGGDEYVILCGGSSEEDVKQLIARIKAEVAKTAYTCSVGYAMKTKGSTIDMLYQLADANLYEEKKLFYEKKGRRGRKR